MEELFDGFLLPSRWTFHMAGSTYEQVFGLLGKEHQSVGKETGETAHVERWNNTLRQRLGRFVRRTLSFSKSDVYYEAALKVFIHEYNENLPVLA